MNHSELIARLRALAKNIADAGITGFGNECSDIADALQAMERVPMTEEAIRRGWLELTELAPTPYAMYVNAVRTTESHHGITPPESKG